MPRSPPPLPLQPPSTKDWQLNRRRSKSLGDLIGKRATAQGRSVLHMHGSDFHHYDDASMLTLPVVSFDYAPASSAVEELPRRRHSSCCDPSAKNCLKVATVYGPSTCAPQQESKSTSPPLLLPPPKRRPLFLHSNSSLSSQRTGSTTATNKLSKMFTRRQTLGSTSFSRFSLRRRSKDSLRQQPSSEQSDTLLWQPTPYQQPPQELEKAKGIVSAIIAAANRPDGDQSSLGWVGVEENTTRESAAYHVDDTISPPTPPIENDPHVFDLLVDNSSQFITFSKRDDTPNVVNSATVEKLVEKLTSDMDSELILVFFLTYRQFLTGIKLCKLLILRFRWALLKDSDERLLVRIRTFVVIRYWLTHYWQHDFATSRTLRFMLSTFLSQLRTHPTITASPRDAHIIESLRNIFKRQRSFFKSAKSSGETRSIRSSVSNMDTILSQNTSRSSTPNPSQRSGSSCASATSRSHQYDNAIGLQWQLKPSVSTPTLSFMYRSRRYSTNSRRSVNGNNAWSARVNFRLKTIKRSVPAMYNNIVGTSPQHQDYVCLCEKEIHRSRSLIRSAGRMFEAATLNSNVRKRYQHQVHHRPQQTTPTPAQSLVCARPPHPSCPLHSATFNPPTPSPIPSHISPDRYKANTASDPMYHPLILRYRSEIISQQFCLIEQQMLQNVTWDELVELRWRNRNKRTAPSTSLAEEYHTDVVGVEQLINYFNMACQWIASEVVQARSLETRTFVVEKYIRIALKCYHHRNYSTLMQILLGLQSPAVTRLERTWQRIDQYEMQVFNELKELAKPFLNWKNVRAAMSEAIEAVDESSAVESVLTKSHMDPAEIKGIRGCIPFLGLYLSDLVFNAELPTAIALSNHDNGTQVGGGGGGDAELCSRLSTHLINYNKCRITASIVKHVMAFQVLSRAYTFQHHSELYNKLKNLTFLDNAEIHKASLLCESL